MAYKIFNIPIPDSENEINLMNKFISSVRIISVHKEIVTIGATGYWSFAIEYFRENGNNTLGKKNKIDYRELLSAEDFAVYSVLRELRKEIAENEGVPVYAIFSNEQLSLFVIKRIDSITALSTISGIGDKKIAAYGEFFVDRLKEIYEANRTSV